MQTHHLYTAHGYYIWWSNNNTEESESYVHHVVDFMFVLHFIRFFSLFLESVNWVSKTYSVKLGQWTLQTAFHSKVIAKLIDELNAYINM